MTTIQYVFANKKASPTTVLQTTAIYTYYIHIYLNDYTEENRLHSRNTHLLSNAYHIPRVYHVYYYIIYQFAVPLQSRVPKYLLRGRIIIQTRRSMYQPLPIRYSVIYADGNLLPRENESAAQYYTTYYICL